MTSVNISCLKTIELKSWFGLDFYVRRDESVHRRVKDKMLSLVRSSSIFDARKKIFEKKIASKPSIIMGPYDSGM